MARFDCFELEDEAGCLLDVQSDLLSSLDTRVVVSLIPRSSAPVSAQRLNPIFSIKDQELVMATQFMAALPARELRSSAGNLAIRRDEISAAVDMLFLGS